jgi:DNA-binding transcriptional LysR family regulator
MELRHLRAFVAVAEEGTFTAAADRLVLVQSAVSAAIRSLERELGVSLFDRTTRRVTLTDAGRALLPEALRTLESARLAADAVDQVKGGLRGTVSLGIMQATVGGAASVASMVSGFQAEHPLVAVTVRHVGGSRSLAKSVRDGDLDLGILSLPGGFPGLSLTELGSERMLLACASAHPLAGRGSVRIVEIADEPFVDGPQDWGLRLASDQLFARAGLERTLRFEVNDSLSIVEFVAEGLAVALLPPSLIMHVPGVQMIPLEGEAPMFRTLLASPTGRRAPAAVQAFAQWIRGTVALQTQ